VARRGGVPAGGREASVSNHVPWETLTALREAHGMSKAELARRAGMNLSHLSALESGRTAPRAATVKQIAEALGVSVGAIPLHDTSVSWMESVVRVMVDAELRRVGLAELAKPIPDAHTPDEYDLRRVGGNMTQRGFLQAVVRVRNLEASDEELTYVHSVVSDAVEWIGKALAARGVTL